MTDRYASLHRQTRETDVTLELSLDGGERKISTAWAFSTTCSPPLPSTANSAST